MSSESYRRQLDQKRKKLAEAEEKSRNLQSKVATARAKADKARSEAQSTKSDSTRKTKLNSAARYDKESASAARDLERANNAVTAASKAVQTAQDRLSREERTEAKSAESRRQRDEKRAQRAADRDRRELDDRLSRAESAIEHTIRVVQQPKPEKLRVLWLGASSLGDLRVGRELKIIRRMVQSAVHRDLVEIDSRTAATVDDLLDGLTEFRPHVVHFSGHSDDDLIEFERDEDDIHDGTIVSATAFANAIASVSEPPSLVLLNSCNSAKQAEMLVEDVVAFAIGMTEEVLDGNAIAYAGRFYATVANGETIAAAHRVAKSKLEMDEDLSGDELPQLFVAEGFDADSTRLVEPPENK
ncbi:CHAT domain-containing protein [Gordonia lacunae]|uniref:CHAT domain-containing protein n=1 Tax=Gordonia lacunae TaxID=417102 RepID=UPI0039E59E36